MLVFDSPFGPHVPLRVARNKTTTTVHLYPVYRVLVANNSLDSAYGLECCVLKTGSLAEAEARAEGYRDYYQVEIIVSYE